MQYIILGVVILIGIVTMCISYCVTKPSNESHMATKLVDHDIPLEKAIEELVLVNCHIIDDD